MRGFNDVPKSELLEFDWFPSVSGTFPEQYGDIEDLKITADRLNRQELNKAAERIGRELSCVPELWLYKSDLGEAMNLTFSNIYEEICGKNLEMTSGLFSVCIDAISARCDVVQSRLTGGSQSNGLLSDVAFARIINCLEENGCVIALVSNQQWRCLAGETESVFFDEGLRTLQILGLDSSNVIISDCADKNGYHCEISRVAFARLAGVLVEVYK